MSEIAASPTTRRFAAENGVDLDALGREIGADTISKSDVARKLAGTSAPTLKPTSHLSYWAVDHSTYGQVVAQKRTRMEKVADANLTAAQHVIPSVTHHDRADMSEIEAIRQRLNPKAAALGVKLTALAFHAKALASCLALFPRFNASLSADGETLWLKQFFHIGIAVDTPFGLMVPVLRDVDKKGLLAIASEISELAQRAQDRKLRPKDMGGASMSISNLGGIGGTAFTPIINPPEVAIMGLARTEMQPIWTGETFDPHPMVPLDLTYDHRVINGADAARFMSHYTGLIAYPGRLVLPGP
jgi:pyruvate/2-oxoglutarate dehydrogenase complex dihydrolipoamide acyltransferase (E2) component